MADTETYEVYAVKYAERDARRAEHFLGGDPHDVPMPMDYFVWVIVGRNATIIVDTGFNTHDATLRERRLLRTAADGLATIGIDAATAQTVVLTHLHYDHVGGFDQFPNARFHLQDREMNFATGRNMSESQYSHAFTARHVAEMVMAVHAKRVEFHDGDAVIASGVSLHHIGGHTDGLQAVRVETATGPLVLASDASHYYENMETARPFPIVFDVPAMVAGYDRLRSLAGAGGVIVPGHDPMVFERHPAADPALSGVAVRLG
jgi:glyoxylase-like metal-dependent hydrolase (beta-lactamase superfamily II)